MMQSCRRVVLFGAGASHGARDEARPPVGNKLHEYVAAYLEKKFRELREWDSHDVTTDSMTATHGVRNKLKQLLANAQSYEGLAGRLSECNEWNLLTKLNFLMAGAMTPPLFPLTPDDEPRVDDSFIEQRDVYDAFVEKRFATSEEWAKTSFITLNYDCLLERAICRVLFKGPQEGESRCLCRHVNYCLRAEGDQPIEVLKPHGSINWVGDLVGSANNEGTILITHSLEPDGRPSYKQVQSVPSSIRRDPDELIIATYAPGKRPQANPELLSSIQERSKSRAQGALLVEIIGVHLPTGDAIEDPFLSDLLELMANKVKTGCRVIYVNPNEAEIKIAEDQYHFETVPLKFREYVETESYTIQ